MRSLYITRNFPPLVGGMEAFNFRLARKLARETQMGLVSIEGATAQLPEARVVREQPTSLQAFLLGSMKSVLSLAASHHPDLVMGGSGLVAPAVWAAGKRAGARTAVLVHGLDLVVRHPLYRALFLPALRRIERVFVNSQHTGLLAEQAGIKSSRICVLNPGTDIPASAPDVAELASFRSRFGLNKKSVLISVGRLTSRKGFVPFLKHSMPALLKAVPDLQWLIVGEEPAHGLLHTAGEQERIEQTAKSLGMAEHVHLVGRLSQDDLELAYALADVHVFPVLDLPGDVEGFGMVALEAAARGVPTVGFGVGGVPDAVGAGSGVLVPGGGYAALSQACVSLLGHEHAHIQADTCMDFARDRQWPLVEQAYWGACQDLVGAASEP